MITLEDILLSLDGLSRAAAHLPPALAHITFHGAAIDSREIRAGDLFVALRGERHDGHDFLAAAVGQGARGALVRRERVEGHSLGQPSILIDPQALLASDGEALPEQIDDQVVVLIAVDDPLVALQQIARAYRRRHNLTVVGITGSVGKTSTKEVTAVVLQQRFNTHKSPRSFNTESTVPLTILDIQPEHEAAVIEMGTYGPGEIALLASIALPQIGIVTNVGPSHLERMKTLETVAQAKGELVEALPSDGWAILNYDDERVRAMASRTQAQVFTYGLNPAADLWADEIEGRGLDGIAFRAHYRDETVHLQLPLIGRHSVHTALAAAATGLILGLSWEDLIAGLKSSNTQLRLLVSPAVGGATIIDDTYNASPVSCLAALNLLAELDGRRVAVFGDMMELGPLEEEGHRMVGRRAADVVDLLITVGERARWIAEEAQLAGIKGEVITASGKQAVVDLLKPMLQPGDYVLVKGGRAMAMEEIVAQLQVPREEARRWEL